jgi:hypothetical protein
MSKDRFISFDYTRLKVCASSTLFLNHRTVYSGSHSQCCYSFIIDLFVEKRKSLFLFEEGGDCAS